jgi:hypothetical protein
MLRRKTISGGAITMIPIKALARSLLLSFFLAYAQPAPAQVGELVVGVNLANPLRASIADQNAIFAQLKAAGVQIIRNNIRGDLDKGIDFLRRAAAQGIRVQLLVGPAYPPDAPARPYMPDRFPKMWGGPPLSSADPDLSRASYRRLFAALDAAGITLAGLELDNEINWAAFNRDIPLPGMGKILSREDLRSTPEGQQIAKGFLQYLKVLAVLKEERDRSRLNRSAPIISAGLVAAPDGEKLYNDKKQDIVSLPATLDFLREHGLDALVDAYGIHTYPSSAQPGDPRARARRTARLREVDLAQCGTAGGDRKPCWITEWGFPNRDLTCPANDAPRAQLVREVRADFAKAAAEGRLIGITYFAWTSEPWVREPSPLSIYRCGGLTESGRLAIAPRVN